MESLSLAEVVPGIDGRIEVSCHGPDVQCEIRVSTSVSLTEEALEGLRVYARCFREYSDVWLLCPNHHPEHFRFRDGVEQEPLP